MGQFESTADRWSYEMKAWKNGQYSKAWIDFRFQKLCGLFIERLKALGTPEMSALAILEALKRLKTEERRVSAPTERTFTPSMRKIAVAAIGGLSDEELRRVWLPLGVILNALGRD
ncbi:MAG: hypothetical protein MN733_01220 [Nitrososphaera sp.]|nr:hypothetical protein [Nitrososphaera sp.]